MISAPPTVSIVTATRSRPELLRQALLSIKRQTYTQFTVAVVDDGSPPAIHEQYRELWGELDERFTLHLASPPGGPGSDPGKGRNFGVRATTGDLIAFLDHDDLWERTDHLEVGVRALTDSGAGYYYTHVRFEPNQPGLMWATHPESFGDCRRVSALPVVYDAPIDRFLKVMRHAHIHPSHSIIRRDVFERAGGFIEGLKTADDVNFMLRVADVNPGILYRPDAAVAIRMPEGKSYSLASSQLTQMLSEHQAMLDLRCRCRTPAVRRCARSREGWVLRRLVAEVRQHSVGEARRLAWESVATFPTAGAVWSFAKSLIFSSGSVTKH